MKPEDARRAAFLLRALDDLRYEIEPPEDAAEDDKRWKGHNPKPIRLEKPTRKIELQIVDGDDGGMHCLAKLEVCMISVAVVGLIANIENELRALGIELQ